MFASANVAVTLDMASVVTITELKRLAGGKMIIVTPAIRDSFFFFKLISIDRSREGYLWQAGCVLEKVYGKPAGTLLYPGHGPWPVMTGDPHEKDGPVSDWKDERTVS